MNADIFHGPNGATTCVPTLIVFLRWHDACKPGCYVVHLQVARGVEQLYSTGIFSAGDLLRQAVVDDFGTLRGVS